MPGICFKVTWCEVEVGGVLDGTRLTKKAKIWAALGHVFIFATLKHAKWICNTACGAQVTFPGPCFSAKVLVYNRSFLVTHHLVSPGPLREQKLVTLVEVGTNMHSSCGCTVMERDTGVGTR